MTENRWRRTLLIVVLVFAAAALLWQGRVAAMYSGAPTMEDLLKKIEALERQMWLSDNNQTYAMGVESMRAVWQTDKEDNVDATHPLSVRFYIPEDARLIDRAFLRLTLLNFRSYGTGAESGGGSTATSADGGATTPTSGGGTWYSDPGYTSGFEATDSAPDHTHGGAVAGDGGHAHVINLNHSHTVTILNHDHDVAIPAHTHGLTHGIYEDTDATDVTVTINGTDRTVALGGAVTGFTADQDSLDIAAYLTVGWNTISLASSQLGRIQATYFVKAYLP
jgi:hypothetical protein